MPTGILPSSRRSRRSRHACWAAAIAVACVAAARVLPVDPPAKAVATAKPPGNIPALASTNAPAAGGTNAAAAGTNALAGVVDPETRELKPHDTFRYRVEQDPTSGAEPMRVTITDSGEAHFNVSRGHSTYVTIKAAGKKLAEVRRELKEKLDAEYYRDASVNLDLDGVYNPVANAGGVPGSALGPGAKVQVYGELQGTFPIPEGQRLWLSDVMLLLPRSETANLSKIQVIRNTPEGKQEIHQVDMDRVLNKFERSKDFELKDGDRIKVPKKIFIGL